MSQSCRFFARILGSFLAMMWLIIADLIFSFCIAFSALCQSLFFFASVSAKYSSVTSSPSFWSIIVSRLS